MSDTPQGAKEQQQPSNLDLIPPEMEQYAASLAGLTTIQQRILWALVDNFSSEISRSEVKIANDIGVSRSTIQRARKTKLFQDAMAFIIRDNVRGLHDKIVGNVMKSSVTDWRAAKFLLEYDGSYVQKSQSMNINANISQSTPSGTPQSAIEASCHKFIGIGYDLERYVAEITEVWTRLKAEGV